MTDTSAVDSSPAGAGSPGRPTRLFTAWERRTRVWALVFAATTVVATLPLVWAVRPGWVMGAVLVLNLRPRVAAVQRELARGRPAFGRNSPCPCGSGLKFKKCCLE